VVNWFKGAGDSFSNFFKGAGKSISDFFGGAYDSIARALSNIWDEIKDLPNTLENIPTFKRLYEEVGQKVSIVQCCILPDTRMIVFIYFVQPKIIIHNINIRCRVFWVVYFSTQHDPTF